MLRLGAVGILLQDELHHQEAWAAVLVILVVIIGAAYGAVSPNVARNADVLIQAWVTCLGEGSSIHFQRAIRIRLEERMFWPGSFILPRKILRERRTVCPRELVHPVEGCTATV